MLGCKIDLDSASVDAALPDAEPPVPCEPGKVCVDVTRKSSDTLGQVGGSLRIPTETDTIIVVRTGDTTFEATSAICTHRRCTVAWTGTLLRCPCHGSQFSLEGVVLKGPADRPLKTYETMFDEATNILSIIIA